MNEIELALKAAIEAGERILDVYNDPESDFSVERKADNSPLTIADKMSHEVIAEYLHTSPYPVLSEEGKEISYNERKKWQKFWLVDPLDGTKEFIKRNGEFTINIALIENGDPVMGVIYVPVFKTLYFGKHSVGAWKMNCIIDRSEITIELLEKEGEKLPVVDPGRKFTVVGSRSHNNEETTAYIKQLEKEYGEIEILSKGSSLKICMVAEGSADVYPRFGPTMEWDTAAGHAIAFAAGKNVTLADHKTPLEYNKENLLNPFFIVH